MTLDKITLIILLGVIIIYASSIVHFASVNNPSLSSITGEDLNSDGVRDDVEEYINKNYQRPEEKAALVQYLKYIENQMLSYNSSNQRQNQFDSRAYDCVYYIFRDKWNGDRFRDIIINTPERRKAYQIFNKNLKSGVYQINVNPSSDVCDYYTKQ